MMPTTGYINQWMGGGVDSGTVTLLDLYWEEKYWRARWSASNQGFDLARYFGCKITLWPSQHYSYVFWWSTEEIEEDKEPLTVCHPSQLLLTKQHVVISNWAGSGRRKGVTIRVKPPTSIINAWWHIKDYAKKPLIKWRVSLLDLEQPWTGFAGNHTYAVPINVWAMMKNEQESKTWQVWYHPMLDDGTGTKVCSKELEWNNNGDGPKEDQHPFWPQNVEFSNLLVPFYMFCFGRSAEWYSNLKQFHRPQPNNQRNGYFLFVKIEDTNIAWKLGTGALMNALKDNMFYIKYNTCQQLAANGPWVEKSILNGCNIAAKMKFFFQWGGTPGTQLPPVQPGEGTHVWPLSTLRWPGAMRADIRDPTISHSEVLKAEDLDSDGIATERAIARITKPHFSTEEDFRPQRKKIWGSVQYPLESRKRKLERLSSSSEEEETPHDSSTEEEEEPRTHQYRRKRKLRKLLRNLVRLGIQPTTSMSLSGERKYHSI